MLQHICNIGAARILFYPHEFQSKMPGHLLRMDRLSVIRTEAVVHKRDVR